MNEDQFAYRVRHGLARSTDLDPRVLARLREAREAALRRYPGERPGSVALAGGLLGRVGAPLAMRVLAPAVVLAVACTAIFTWQQNQRAAEVEELDAQLLSSDLPIDAYLDPGFITWLKRHASQQH
ncbi:MAG: DUF3619 family protein [Burkholderiales bacterium]